MSRCTDDRSAGEKRPLLGSARAPPAPPPPRLTALGAACCVVDLFGVFPVLALPRALLACGWAGAPLALAVVALQAHTARLLGRCWLLAAETRPRWAKLHRRVPYAALAELAFGPRARRAVAALLHAAVFGAYVPDLLFAAENMHLVGRAPVAAGGRRAVLLHVAGGCWRCALCPMLWLGSPKDQKWVTGLSVGLVVSVAALTWACVAHTPWQPRRPPSPAPAPAPSSVLPAFSLQAAALAYGNLVFQFDAHPALLTVQVDMAEPRRLGHAITGAYALSAALALATTLLAGVLRPDAAWRQDVLQALPGSPPLYAAVLLATLQIMLSTVVGGSALFQDLEQRLGISPEFSWRRCALRVTLLATAVLVALASPRLPLAMGLLGAAVTGPLSLVLPPLLYARLRMRLRGPEETPDEQDDAALLLAAPRRDSTEAALAEAEATKAAEAAARGALLSDASYRRLADDTRVRGAAPPWGCCSRLLAAADRRLALDEAKGEPSRLHVAGSVALAAAGAVSSAAALYFTGRDAAQGISTRRGQPSCLGLPF